MRLSRGLCWSYKRDLHAYTTPLARYLGRVSEFTPFSQSITHTEVM